MPGLLAALILAGQPIQHEGEIPILHAHIQQLVHAHHGKVAVFIKHLQTGEEFSVNENEPMPTASLIKLAVMIEVYQQVAEGKIKLSDPITLRKEDRVPGSGVLTDMFTPGLTLCLRDAVRLMIDVSDNTATNLVLDKIGIGATAKRMEAWGYLNTKINAKSFKGSTTSVFPERTKRFGLGSTTAREMVGLLEKLHEGKLVNPEACKEMITILKYCNDREKFPRYLPVDVSVAHKSGWASDVSTDAGILYWKKGPVAICVLTCNNEDKRWSVDNAAHLLCGRIAKEAYDYFNLQLDPPPVPPAKK
jgi:D-alanyl-D-alanine carboxypeptidase (penicillin-binding protein 5/6)/beta-lactamase class A